MGPHLTDRKFFHNLSLTFGCVICPLIIIKKSGYLLPGSLGRRADCFKDLALELNLLSDPMVNTRRSREQARQALGALKKDLTDRGDPGACVKKIDEVLSIL